MKIRISDISSSGLKINDTISLSALNKRMSEGAQEADIVFIEAPSIEITVKKTHGGAETRGTARSRYRQACSLCLKGVKRDVEVDTNFEFSYPSRVPQRGQEDTSTTDDMEMYTIKNDHIEIEELIQENLILSLSVYWHPPVDEKGSCTTCKLKPGLFGADTPKESTQSLGALLVKALPGSDKK